MGIKFAEKMPFPMDLAGVTFGVIATINPLWEYMIKYMAERMKKYAAEVEKTEEKTPNRQSESLSFLGPLRTIHGENHCAPPFLPLLCPPQVRAWD